MPNRSNRQHKSDSPVRLLVSTTIIAGLFIVCSLPELARAQAITTQLRWNPLTSSAQTDWDYYGDDEGLKTADIETGFAIGIKIDKVVLRSSLALGRVEITGGDETYSTGDNTKTFETRRITFVTPSISTQYFLTSPRAEVLVPFVIMRVGKTLAFFSESRGCSGSECPDIPWEPTAADEKQNEFREDLYSPWHLSLGGGGDYFIGDGASLGMEAGVRFSKAASHYADDERTYEGGSQFSTFDLFYGAITVNLFWN